MIVRDEDVKKKYEDLFVDRSHLNYDTLLDNIKREYSNSTTIIDTISEILSLQSKERQTIIGKAKNGNVYAKSRLVKMYLRTVMKQAYDY